MPNTAETPTYATADRILLTAQGRFVNVDRWGHWVTTLQPEEARDLAEGLKQMADEADKFARENHLKEI